MAPAPRETRRVGAATFMKMEDGVGFEPTRRLPVCRFSRPVPSTARPPIPLGMSTGRLAHERSPDRSLARPIGTTLDRDIRSSVIPQGPCGHVRCRKNSKNSPFDVVGKAPPLGAAAYPYGPHFSAGRAWESILIRIHRRNSLPDLIQIKCSGRKEFVREPLTASQPRCRA
jgi:hypothetical protein